MTGRPELPAAVVFDFDGVVVNTEPLHFEAFQQVLGPLDLAFAWEEYVAWYIGFDDRDAFKEVFRRGARDLDEPGLQDLIGKKADAFEQLARDRGAEPFPGVVALIKSLAGRTPAALCSGALRRDIDPILDRLGLGRAFDVVVSADDVAASKPDPASYRLVLERLGRAFPGRTFPPPACVAVEDTPAGIAAAKGAGMAVLAVANSYRREELREAARVVDSLEGVTPEDLARLAAPGKKA